MTWSLVPLAKSLVRGGREGPIRIASRLSPQAALSAFEYDRSVDDPQTVYLPQPSVTVTVGLVHIGTVLDCHIGTVLDCPSPMGRVLPWSVLNKPMQWGALCG